MSEVKWQLPVNQSNTTDHDWIHPKAKFHAFINNDSICGKHGQNTDYFNSDLEEPLSKKIACHTCMNKLNLF